MESALRVGCPVRRTRSFCSPGLSDPPIRTEPLKRDPDGFAAESRNACQSSNIGLDGGLYCFQGKHGECVQYTTIGGATSGFPPAGRSVCAPLDVLQVVNEGARALGEGVIIA